MTTEVREPAILPILSHWIDGRPVEVLPEQTGPVYNPATGQVIGRVPRGGRAGGRPRPSRPPRPPSPPGATLPLIARSQVFFAFRELVWQHREEMAALITRDHGKTFPDALAEVFRGLETVEFACGLPVHLAGMNTPNVATNVDAFTLRQPLGVTAAITPFNFPVMVPMWIYPIALACGNTLVWKPSSPHARARPSSRPSCGRRPACPTASSTSSTAAARRSARSSSTPTSRPSSSSARPPSAATSTRRARSAASGSARYTSAKNAMIVLPDADMELTADAAVASGYGSAGERCMAQTLVIAVGDTGDRLRPLMLERIAKLKVGPGMEPGIDMGPIYSAEHRESVIDWIDKGEAEGAELVVDGRPFVHPTNPDGFFLGVTLFDHVTPDMEIYQEEIFGPVLGHRPGEDLRRGARPHQRPQVRQRHGDLHDRRRRRAALQARGRRADDRRQRADPGAGRLPLVRRRQGVRARRPGHARRGRDPLLHPAEDGHRALAGARPARRPQPRLPRQQLILEPAGLHHAVATPGLAGTRSIAPHGRQVPARYLRALGGLP